MKKKELYKEVNKLTKDQEEKLKKKFPKIPKKTKEEIQYRQVKRKAKCENICIFLITMFFLTMIIASILVIYLMLTYKW